MPSDLPPPSSPPSPPSGSVAAPDVARFAEPRRLHPASVVLGIPLAQLIQALVFPAAATFAAGGAFTIGLLLLVGIVGLVFRILAWQREVYSFDGEVFRVDSGVLSRSHRSLAVGRIQQVEIERGAIQRLFGLAALRVETAGSSSEPEVDLRVMPEADAVALRSAVRVSKARLQGRDAALTDGGVAGEEPHEVLRVPNRHIAIAAVTGARLLVFPAVIGGAFQFIGQQIDAVIRRTVAFLVDRGIASPEGEIVGAPGWATIAGVAAAVVAFALLTAVIVGLLRDGNYRMVRIDDDLHVSRGLVSTRDSVIPLRRVQLVEVQRNWLRRLLGFATVRIRSAGGSTGGDGRVTVPLMPEADVDRLLSEVFPGVPGVPALSSHPPAARRRALFRWLRPAVLTIAAVWIIPELVTFMELPFIDRARLLVVLLLPLNVLLALVEYRQLAHGLTERVLASRRGALSISTTLAPLVKVQAVSSRRSLFQRRLGLTTVVAHVTGPGALVEVLDADAGDGVRLHARLTEHAASPIPLDLPR